MLRLLHSNYPLLRLTVVTNNALANENNDIVSSDFY